MGRSLERCWKKSDLCNHPESLKPLQISCTKFSSGNQDRSASPGKPITVSHEVPVASVAPVSSAVVFSDSSSLHLVVHFIRSLLVPLPKSVSHLQSFVATCWLPLHSSVLPVIAGVPLQWLWPESPKGLLGCSHSSAGKTVCTPTFPTWVTLGPIYTLFHLYTSKKHSHQLVHRPVSSRIESVVEKKAESSGSQLTAFKKKT